MKNASSCATCFMQWAKEMLGVTLQPKASFYLLYECRYHQSEMAGGIFIPISKKVLRHEVIHGFLYESGLWNNSGNVEAWGRSEEITDWIAIQFPKMLKAFQEVGCL